MKSYSKSENQSCWRNCGSDEADRLGNHAANPGRADPINIHVTLFGRFIRMNRKWRVPPKTIDCSSKNQAITGERLQTDPPTADNWPEIQEMEIMTVLLRLKTDIYDVRWKNTR